MDSLSSGLSGFLVSNIPGASSIKNIASEYGQSKKELDKIKHKRIMIEKIKAHVEETVSSGQVVSHGKAYKLSEERLGELNEQLRLVNQGLLKNKKLKNYEQCKLVAQVFKEVFLEVAVDAVIPPICNEHIKNLASVAIATLGEKLLERSIQSQEDRTNAITLLKNVISDSLKDFASDQVANTVHQELLPDLINANIANHWSQHSSRI